MTWGGDIGCPARHMLTRRASSYGVNGHVHVWTLDSQLVALSWEVVEPSSNGALLEEEDLMVHSPTLLSAQHLCFLL